VIDQGFEFLETLSWNVIRVRGTWNGIGSAFEHYAYGTESAARGFEKPNPDWPEMKRNAPAHVSMIPPGVTGSVTSMAAFRRFPSHSATGTVTALPNARYRALSIPSGSLAELRIRSASVV
jgi:hypothetical protein